MGQVAAAFLRKPAGLLRTPRPSDLCSGISLKDRQPNAGFRITISQRVREARSGRGDLNSRPLAPKSGVLFLGSPSFSILGLKTKELEKYLVVASCADMWLHMHGVSRIFPIAKTKRKCSDRFQLPDKNPRFGLGPMSRMEYGVVTPDQSLCLEVA